MVVPPPFYLNSPLMGFEVLQHDLCGSPALKCVLANRTHHINGLWLPLLNILASHAECHSSEVLAREFDMRLVCSHIERSIDRKLIDAAHRIGNPLAQGLVLLDNLQSRRHTSGANTTSYRTYSPPPEVW